MQGWEPKIGVHHNNCSPRLCKSKRQVSYNCGFSLTRLSTCDHERPQRSISIKCEEIGTQANKRLFKNRTGFEEQLPSRSLHRGNVSKNWEFSSSLDLLRSMQCGIYILEQGGKANPRDET